MDATIANPNAGTTWNGGGDRPFGASYGKMMMWFFLFSDALTFSAFLGAYGFMRFKFLHTWPIADEVFMHIPFTHIEMPMIYVAFMSFVLIFSSVTMVLAVDAGHQMKKNKVILYMFLTIIGGIIFIGSQAWEWKNFIKGGKGAIELNNGQIIKFVNKEGHQISVETVAGKYHTDRVRLRKNEAFWFYKQGNIPLIPLAAVIKGYKNNPNSVVKTERTDPGTRHKIVVNHAEGEQLLLHAKQVVKCANLKVNEYGRPLFADFFFFITGFHGFHVTSGIIVNLIIFFN
ncbi:MAG TPA: cytochrome oxidase subunit III, partial [Flavobacteriia bacterium]|nr:cytochrome oxidase subunit III [Flavobacteriia bacterium]